MSPVTVTRVTSRGAVKIVFNVSTKNMAQWNYSVAGEREVDLGGGEHDDLVRLSFIYAVVVWPSIRHAIIHAHHPSRMSSHRLPYDNEKRNPKRKWR